MLCSCRCNNRSCSLFSALNLDFLSLVVTASWSFPTSLLFNFSFNKVLYKIIVSYQVSQLPSSPVFHCRQQASLLVISDSLYSSPASHLWWLQGSYYTPVYGMIHLCLGNEEGVAFYLEVGQWGGRWRYTISERRIKS